MKWLPRLLLGVAAVLLVAAAWQYAQPPEQRTLSFETTELDLGEVAAGEEMVVTFRAVNSGSRPRQILNISPRCSLNCCFLAKKEGWMEVPANGQVDYEVEVKTYRPGQFGVETVLFIDDNGLRQVPVKVIGTAVGGDDEAEGD